MKRLAPLTLAVLLLAEVPAHAIIVDTIASGISYAQQQAYQAFMKLKVIEEIQILKQNYDASVRYYEEFKRLNQGRGILYNVAEKLKTTELQEIDQLKGNVDRDFIHTYRTDTQVDKFFQGIDRGIATNMKYSGDELANLISNRKVGADIARNAGDLSPKDAANMAVKAQGIQLQYLAQIHEDNLRMIQLESMKLANDTRRQQSEQKLIDDVRKSVQRVAPDAVPRNQDDSQENQQ